MGGEAGALRQGGSRRRHVESLRHCGETLRHGGPLAFPSVMRSTVALALPLAAAQLHAYALRAGCHGHPFVLTALISTYARLSLLHLSRRIFQQVFADEDAPADTLVACCNAMISGCALHSLPSAAISIFHRMRRAGLPFNSLTMLALIPSCSSLGQPPASGESLHACNIKFGMDCDPSVANCLLTMYARRGAVDLARRLFDSMPRSLITWNAMISAYAQNGLASQVLDLYRDMERYGVEPDAVTLVGVLSSCANLGARAVGLDVERRIAGCPGLSSNVFLGNALINMHARCGNLTRARALFDRMPERSVVSWTAIIAGYGMHGHGETALRLFDDMGAAGIRADGVILVSVLSACSHAGLTDKGLEYFSGMERVYGVVPRVEHYACMVDLLGRAGRLKDALLLICSMPVEADGAVWGALLGACKIYRNVWLAELAFQQVIELEPTNVGYYVLLSNIYSDAGILDGMVAVRGLVRQRGLRKDPGCSYIELNKRVHLFLADDQSHPQTNYIYQMLDELEAITKECDKNRMGMTSDIGGIGKNNDDDDEVGTAKATGFHSEKLAVAFGILNTEVGTDIVVMKNLRVCVDCHLFIKSISRIVNREIVVRDASRFHHFKGGVCSCSDFW